MANNMVQLDESDLFILDRDFKTIFLVDKFESFIWTDRYYDNGEFEIYSSPEDKILSYAIKDYYLYKASSEHMMIIDGLEIQSDTEMGNHLIIRGRSLESLLDRRVVWDQTVLNGDFQNGVKTLINQAIISPSISDRAISNFVFEDSDDPYILEQTIDTQFTGDNLLDVIRNMCQEKKVGFKITLNDNNEFVFKLYYGKNRSYSQTANPYVIFSPNFENIINSNYLEDKVTLKNVALVAGEDRDRNRKIKIVGSGSGIDRRELYVDARDIQSEVDGQTIPDVQYYAMLEQRGNEKLAENKETIAFEGEVEAYKKFIYGESFFMGDIVQVENEYGMTGTARVTEFVMSHDASGKKSYPTFTTEDE